MTASRYVYAMASPSTLADFGHGSLKIGGSLATSGRRLRVVLADYSETPSINAPHTNQYYESLAFGDPTPPFSTDNPVNPASLREYVRENSYGRWWLDRAGLVGPLQLGALGADPGPVARCTASLKRVTGESREWFFASDPDGNQVVAQTKPSIVLVENLPQRGARRKPADPGPGQHRRRTGHRLSNGERAPRRREPSDALLSNHARAP
jgi:hypothetical protein